MGLKFVNEMIILMRVPSNFKQKMLLKLSNFSSDLFFEKSINNIFFRVAVF